MDGSAPMASVGLDPLSGVRLTYPAICFLGVQLAWALQIGWVSPHLRKLGLTDGQVGLAWLAGPLSGIVVQPIVGYCSDRCTSRFGRRRPFLVAGLLLTTIGLLGFSNALQLAKLFGAERGSSLPIVFALISLWWLDFSINVIQGPIRALMTDRVLPKRLSRANSYFAMANGVGKTLGYALGAISHSLQLVYGVGAAIVVLSGSWTILMVPEETQYNEQRGDRTILSMILEPFGMVTRMPTALQRAFVVQFCTYYAWFATFVYATLWCAQDVAGGSPEGPADAPEHQKFDHGVQQANLGLALMSGLSIVIAAILPSLMRRVGVRAVWFISMSTMGVILILSPLVRSMDLAVASLAGLALPLASTMTIAWAIATSSLTDSPDGGGFLAAFNLSQSTPQLLTSLLGTPLLALANGRSAGPLAGGGVAALIGAALTYFVEVPENLHRSRDLSVDYVADEFLPDYSDSD